MKKRKGGEFVNHDLRFMIHGPCGGIASKGAERREPDSAPSPFNRNNFTYNTL
jgi:hypothetical protein